MRHKPVVIFADDLYDRILSDANNQRPSDYGVRPGARRVWLVTWPEHVINPRFNSDASYGRVGSARTLAGFERIARREGARAYGI